MSMQIRLVKPYVGKIEYVVDAIIEFDKGGE